MYSLLKLENNEDYFIPISNRKNRGTFFCRIIGFDKEHMLFFRRYQIETQKKGLYTRYPLHNPDNIEINYLFKVIDSNFEIDLDFITKAVVAYFNKTPYDKSQLFSKALYNTLLSIKEQGMTESVLKNAFVKIMCWTKKYFENLLKDLGADSPPKILFEGDITKLEVVFLHVMQVAGCDVLYLNFNSDESYKKVDNLNQYSTVKILGQIGEVDNHFSTIDLSQVKVIEELKQKTNDSTGLIITNSWINENFMDVTCKSNSERGLLPSEKIYNIYGGIFGITERREYEDLLYNWKIGIENAGKTFILIEHRLVNPSIEEVKSIKHFQYNNKEQLIAGLALQIEKTIHDKTDQILQTSLFNTLDSLNEPVLSKLHNLGVKLLCWLKRYQKQLFSSEYKNKIPVFVYYGNCSETEALFFEMLSGTPVDVIIISPDKQGAEFFLSNKAIKKTFENSSQIFPFPQKEPKVRKATAAYSAERDLDTILYEGTGLFRNRQFVRSKPLTLKTTYDEVKLLWREESKYRTGFEVNRERVVVPNLFAKISGSETDDQAHYRTMLASFITDRSILISALPHITGNTPNPVKMSVHKYIKNGEIDPVRIKKDSVYPYDYLKEDTQDFILEKMQQMIDLNLLKTDVPGLEYTILSVVLNLDKETIRLIREFDFTSEIPKLIILDADEKMCSLEDCIYILFLNLVGFDIIVFNPSGYRSIEKYIDESAFDEHQLQHFIYEFKTQGSLKQNTAKKDNSIFGRFFKGW